MSEELHRATLRGPMRTRTDGASTPWAGRTVLASGSATVTVSTATVQSDSLFQMATEVASIGIAANSGGNVVVSSIVDAVSFAFARATGVAVPWDETVMWQFLRTSWKS